MNATGKPDDRDTDGRDTNGSGTNGRSPDDRSTNDRGPDLRDTPDFTKGRGPEETTGTDGGAGGEHPGENRAGEWSELLVREQSWAADGPAEIEIAIQLGRITVELSDTDTDTDVSNDSGTGSVWVELRHDPAAGGGWAQGMSGFMNWVGAAAGLPDDADHSAADGVQNAEISWSETGRRLVVRSARDLPARLVPLAVTVRAPAGSRLAAKTGDGDVVVTGTANWAALRTGSGDVRAAAVAGDLDVTSGSGDIAVGSVTGRARVRTGTGTVRVDDVRGPIEVKSGSGDVLLGSVAGDLGARTGSGAVRIADAVTGRFDLSTGSGNLVVGVHPGALAELDLATGSGRARSDLPVTGTAPADGTAALRVRGRTSTGDVLVTRASPAR